MAQTRSRILTTRESFATFDSADYLPSVDDVGTFLEAVVEEADDDPALITQALGAIVRSRNLSKLARAGMSREGRYKASQPTANPLFAGARRLLSDVAALLWRELSRRWFAERLNPVA